MKILYFFVLIIIFPNTRIIAQINLKGTLYSKSGAKISGANISLKSNNNQTSTTSTGEDGKFTLKNISIGKYQLEISSIGFKNYTESLLLRQDTEINITLSENIQVLSNVNVFTKLNAEQEASSRVAEKNANNIINVISAQVMERSPDINAANVLQRMSGVTLQKNSGADEAYAILRGLEPRYNNTLINGSKITSPDEKSRYVSLNVVPSDLLQKIEVSKSLLPEMEADAIGGTVNLVMKDAPDTVLFKVIGSLGYSNIFFDRQYVYFSKKDIEQKSLYDRFGSSYVAQPEDFSRTNLDFNNSAALPTGTLGISFGKRVSKNKLGFLIADNFQNQYYGTNSQYNQAVPDIYQNKPTISDVAIRRISTQQLNNGLTLHADYNFNDKNKIILTNVFLTSYLAQAREIIDTAIKGGNGGRTVPGTGPVSNDYLSITEHQYLENLKLEGKHILSNHFLFDWAGVFSVAAKRAPDRADLNINTKIDTVHTTGDINGPYEFSQTPYYFDQISRIWQHNNDKDYDAIANLSYRSTIKKFSLELKTGGLYRHKTRFNIQNEYDLKPVANANGVKQQFNDIYSAQWIVYDTKGTQAYDINNYKLFENITAGYIQAKISSKNFDLFGGVRTEKTEQGYTLNTFYATGINALTKNYVDVLPSVMFKYKLNDKTNLRLSYFKSISRPNFYELVPATLLSNSSPTAETGNPNLKHSVADNFDIRYELFPKEEEQFFIGAFYKKIKDPIEYAYEGVETYTPQNLGNATVYGGEVVYTKYFRDFGVTGNYTYIYSEISSPKFYTDVVAQTTDPSKLQKRPLQGQTNNTVNLSLLYRNDKHKIFAQLAYEYLGKTLARVYPVYGYDYYLTPQSFLSLSAEKQLRNRHFVVFGKFNNLLNTATVNKINDLLVAKDIYKANFSFGLRYSN
ncbi:MAG TPA: TonB-dependent receptor [Chitinophagaceae bacterium]